MAKTSLKQIEELLQPIIETLGYELWGIEFFASMRPALIRIFIDRIEGYVSLDDCVGVSREVSAILDVEDLIAGSYKLEVSSPGLERPLFRIEHYRKFIGSEVQIRLFAPENGRRKFSGKIKDVTDHTVIIVATENDTERVFELPFEKIEKANLSVKY